MTDDETEIMRDMYRYLNDYGDKAISDAYWVKAAEALSEFGAKWRYHPLAVKLGVALYEYLEIKQDATTKGA